MSSIEEFLISERSFVLVSSCVVQRASKNQRAFILYPEYHINDDVAPSVAGTLLRPEHCGWTVQGWN